MKSQTLNEAHASSERPAIGIMGVSCRLPGAEDYGALKALLLDNVCAVSEVPADRFRKARYFHPNMGVPGKSYTFAAGVLDTIWDFDPTPFGISPREATQMDPQQRLLLQVVWEAIEDCGVAHTTLAGHRVGVYVGASSTDHRDHNTFDAGSTDPYMMTGNTLSLISNRISYIFDFQGPSFTVDTACSSSLVAMSNAVHDLQAGTIDTAVVAGVNALLSPFPFIGFSAAGMLSPVGRCKAFDADGQGYVRAEGGVAVILQRTDLADDAIRMPRARGEILAAGVNSDGKTVGVSLPSEKTQGALLRQLYDEAGVGADDVTFFEAHGTGTRVGDPAEARAVGEVIGRHRTKPLPIGSIKSNIGHLEPAAGLAGLLKALIAFEEGVLPASLHFKTPNPDIPFDDYKLQVVNENLPLPASETPRHAGVSTFGFGGTNAHVILREARSVATSKAALPHAGASVDGNPRVLRLSAHGDGALRAMAQSYARLLDENPGLSIETLQMAIERQRPHLADTLCVRAESTASLSAALDRFAGGDDTELVLSGATLATGRAERVGRHVAFVFTGNGAQFAGMGRDEYHNNADFRECFDAISDKADAVLGWSARDMLLGDDLETDIESSAIAQPLLFLLQIAVARSLGDIGIVPHACFGHSVGEVAASVVAGALSLKQGIKVIHARSQQQETTRGKGKMAVGALSAADAETVLSTVRKDGHTIALAAINADTSVTVSGDVEGIEKFAKAVKAGGRPSKVLDLDYGFHCALMDPIESGLKDQLSDLRPGKSHHAFISTVDGAQLQGEALDGTYWWRNIREPVLFQKAVEQAYDIGCRIFIEIGPRALFRSNVKDVLSDKSEAITFIDTLKQKSGSDPQSQSLIGHHIELAALAAMSSGAQHQAAKAQTTDLPLHITLPSYPWQNKTFKVEQSQEATDAWGKTGDYHMLLGHPGHTDARYWRSHLDAHVVPFLRDHKVDGKIIVPGAALAEMALAAARSFFDSDQVEIRDMDIVRAMELSDEFMLETNTEISADASSVSISSRRRLSDDEWSLHANARIAKIPTSSLLSSGEEDGTEREDVTSRENAPSSIAPEKLYDLAIAHGLDYGPTFARVRQVIELDDNVLHVALADPNPAFEAIANAQSFGLHPTDLDAAFHGLLALYERSAGAIKKGYIPIRFGQLRVVRPTERAASARVRVIRHTPRTMTADFHLYNAEGDEIASLHDARFRAASLVQRQKLEDYTYHYRPQLTPYPADLSPDNLQGGAKGYDEASTSLPDGEWSGYEPRLLLEAAAQRIAFDAVSLYTDDGTIASQSLLQRGFLQPSDMARLSSFLAILDGVGLAQRLGGDEDIWSISAQTDLPEASIILQTVLADHPLWSAEAIMLSHVAQYTKQAGLAAPEADSLFELATMDHYRTASPEARLHVDAVLAGLEHALAAWPKDRAIRILEIGNRGGGLTRKLARLLADGRGKLVSAGSDQRTNGLLRVATARDAHVTIVDVDALPGLLEDNVPFDFVVSASGLHKEAQSEMLLRHGSRALRGGGHLIVSETTPTTLHDVMFGYNAGWFDRTANEAFPLSAQRVAEEWSHVCEGAGFRDISVDGGDDETLPMVLVRGTTEPPASEASNVITLHRPTKLDERDATEEACPVVILSDADDDFAASVVDRLGSGAHTITVALDDTRVERLSDLKSVLGESQIHVVDATHASHAETQTGLSNRVKRLNGLLRTHSQTMKSLWIIAEGGARSLADLGPTSPPESGIWTYARTLRNEYPDITIRTVDFDNKLSEDRRRSLLPGLLLARPTWSEAILSNSAVVELSTSLGAPSSDDITGEEALDASIGSTLSFEDLAGLDDLNWQHRVRQAPGPHEVEVEVAATGLNFRDVMWGLGILPDEALEDGFAGATLGFECSGRVIAVGHNVTKLAVGDPVIALGPACFSSHVTVDEISVSRLPDDVDVVAAATMPVTFLTAYYALDELARLEEDEWVLIQGGAGGVGLAAIQIAQLKGARIIATAGTDEKRNLLRTLGVDHVLDSRSLDFVDAVMAITGEGVDVVLNSLFGEAMERGIELLKPFGRFLELGKRDYYGNTKIGLRPFRRNITYYGIDADQLLSQKPKLAERLFKELMAHFESGQFSPLP
ncbi:MAG: beta-ketoacyl synthase N-terminal-like domain-containing protein, partial [Pseudomonadota bacterium]